MAFLSAGCGTPFGGEDSTTTAASTGGGTTASITLSADPTSIPADGSTSTSITATLKDSAGNAVAEGTSVTFSTTLGTFSGGSTSKTISTTDDTGVVVVSLIAGTTAGSATVTATSNSVTQTTSVTFTESGGGTPEDPESIEVYSIQSASITVKGSGAPETSKVTFVVKDINGLEVADGTAVNFSIAGGGVGGGESLSSSSDTTLGGYVNTTLQSGTVAGTVKINAEWADDTSVATNATITIAGGAAYGEHISISPETLNIAGLVYSGLEDTMTALLADKYSNNVPDGTSVYFTTNYGTITGSAVTESNDGASASFATATLTSGVDNPPDGFVTPLTSTQSGAYARVLCMAIDSVDNDIIYLGTDGGGIFKTSDGGTNWHEKNSGLTNGIIRDIEIDSENSAILYAATDGGVFRSTGSADSWEKVSGAKEVTGETPSGNGGVLDTTDANNDGYSDQVYTLAYSSNGIRSKTYVYLNGVETYQYVYTSFTTIRFIVKGLGAGGEAITVDYTTAVMIPYGYSVRDLALRTNVTGAPETSRTLYAGTYGKGIYQSTDSGLSWSAKNSGLSDQDVLSLAIDPTTNATLYAGTEGGGVFKTTDSAGTWAASNFGLLASVIHAITIDPNTTSSLYIGTEENGMYYSTDSAGTWTAPTTNVTSTKVTKIVLDSTDNPATEIYAATLGDGVVPLGGVYKSSDSGATWAHLTALSENHVQALGIIEAATDTLFAGTWGRNLFKSTDGGTTWSASNGSSPNELTNRIFATTKVLFSDNIVTPVIVQTDTTWQGAGGDDYQHSGDKRNCIYNTGAADFIYTVQDGNGNPLVAGTTITASVDNGSLSGDKSITLADTQTTENYALTWTNNIDDTDNQNANLTINVVSDNGDVTKIVSRTLIKPVAVSIAPSSPAAGAVVTVTPSGGSEATEAIPAAGGSGYTILCGDGTTKYCNEGDTVDYPAGASGLTETVTVTDDVTGQSASTSYTIP